MGKKKEKSNTHVNRLAGVDEGCRDDAIFKYACSLRARNADYEEAKVLILKKAANCNPPFSEQETLAKLDNAYKRYASKVEELSAIEEFIALSATNRINEMEQNLKNDTYVLYGLALVGQITLFLTVF